MIIVTGAGGKTGKAVVKALASKGKPVLAIVHRSEQVVSLKSLGAQKAVAGELLDRDFLKSVFQGGQAIYHICSNMNPAEMPIAEQLISAAKAARIGHFVYHSVLHPQVEAMPHHWQKMRVEERLFTSGLCFSILQPGPYMQNILSYWESITAQGIYPVPYSPDARLSIVDLEDVAEAASRVICEPEHYGAIYELTGPEPLSQIEVAEILSIQLSRPVTAQRTDRVEWEKRMRAGNMNAYAIESLLKMFEYYENYGLTGNPRVLTWILGRAPCCFSTFLGRVVPRA